MQSIDLRGRATFRQIKDGNASTMGADGLPKSGKRFLFVITKYEASIEACCAFPEVSSVMTKIAGVLKRGPLRVV
jgi:hypothetical protein